MAVSHTLPFPEPLFPEKISLTIQAGTDKKGRPESIASVTIHSGEIVGIVGPTGSGKTTLIDDIEQLAAGDTATGRRVLINGTVPEMKYRYDPHFKFVAQLSQNMHFLADMTVADFLKMHAKSRGKALSVIPGVIRAANTLCGEPVFPDDHLTVLSGGQSRALMTADIALISDSPIVLIDEIENAGIKKKEALKLLSGTGKIVIVVTHDPVLALSAGKRIILFQGEMKKVVKRTAEEKRLCDRLDRYDSKVMDLRESIRNGESLTCQNQVIL